MKQDITKTTSSNIPIDNIILEGQLIRAGIDDDHVIELSNSIARHGLLEPIVVAPRNGKYQLIAGLHRTLACMRLGWKTIPAVIRPLKKNDNIKTLAMVENIIRKDMTIEEECTAVKKLYEEEGLSISQICDLLGRSRQWVEIRLTANNLPEDIKNPLFEGNLPLRTAMKIAEVEDESIRKQITHHAVMQKLPYQAVCDMVQLYKDVPSIPEAIQQGAQEAYKVLYEEASKKTCYMCGRKRQIAHMISVFVCANQKECAEHVLGEDKNAD